MSNHPVITSFVDEGLGNSSYLVDLGDGGALAVDPVRDPTGYLAEAERRNLTVRFSVETHLHADFISGGRDLAALGAELVAPKGAGLAYTHRGVEDAEELDVGGLTLRAIATPGHTPEHLSYLLLDGNRPLALFSGGAVIVGSIARTDLVSPDLTDALARQAYRAVRGRFADLPDDLPVYPTHGGGSFCSVAASGERTTTIGWERRSNPIFTVRDEDSFVTSFLGSLGSYPPYFLRTRALNQRGLPTGAHLRRIDALDVDRVKHLIDDGTLVIDARPFEAFCTGHIPGSISIELRAQFATWLGWVVPNDVPLVFVLDEEQDRAEALRQAVKIGYDSVVGELDGGVRSWAEAGFDLAGFALVEPGDRSGALVDIRQSNEVAAGMIPGAHHVEAASISPSMVPDGPLTLYCGHGQRATTAASLLARTGVRDIGVLVGGPDEWSTATGEPLSRSA